MGEKMIIQTVQNSDWYIGQLQYIKETLEKFEHGQFPSAVGIAKSLIYIEQMTQAFLILEHHENPLNEDD
jgi:hypothetical protein|tara:strand:- start:7497 stop:7706 length:210 start_codon:yes stop_codon:yes gene_type:complete